MASDLIWSIVVWHLTETNIISRHILSARSWTSFCVYLRGNNTDWCHFCCVINYVLVGLGCLCVNVCVYNVPQSYDTILSMCVVCICFSRYDISQSRCRGIDGEITVIWFNETALPWSIAPLPIAHSPVAIFQRPTNSRNQNRHSCVSGVPSSFIGTPNLSVLIIKKKTIKFRNSSVLI